MIWRNSGNTGSATTKLEWSLHVALITIDYVSPSTKAFSQQINPILMKNYRIISNNSFA